MSYDDFLKTFIEENKDKVERNIFFSGYDKLVDKCCEFISNKMNSEFVQRMLTIYKVMSEQYGYDMVLLEGYRSPGRQAKLLKQGSHVTKASSYKSYHQFGLAGDSAFIRNGKIVITEKDPWAMQGYKLYGKVAKSAGLVWGGDWRMMDLGHVELRKPGVLGRPQMAEILTSQ